MWCSFFANSFEKIPKALWLGEGIIYMYWYLPNINFSADSNKKGDPNIVYPTPSDLSDNWLSNNEDTSFSLMGFNSVLRNIINIKGKYLHEQQKNRKVCIDFSLKSFTGVHKTIQIYWKSNQGIALKYPKLNKIIQGHFVLSYFKRQAHFPYFCGKYIVSLTRINLSDGSSNSHFRSNTQKQILSNFILNNMHGERSTNDYESREEGP